MSKRIKRSVVWDHFKKKGEDKVTCNFCEAELAYSSGTSSMRNHLAAKHPSVSIKESASDTAPPQSKLTNYVQVPRRCDSQRAEQLTQRICRMIEIDMQPVSVIEDEGFLQVLSFTEPEYVMPCRTTITKRIEHRYEGASCQLKKLLSTAEHVALTTDCWTALTTESYITITCHHIDKEWKLHADVLTTHSLSQRHTAENLAEAVNSAVDDWGLTGRVTTCVHDNGSNIVKAMSPAYVVWDSVPCYAHTLQLAIGDGFAVHVVKVIGAAGRLVKHFHKSGPAAQSLKRKQEGMGLNTAAGPKTLIKSCKTRWNSVYDMFERLVELRWAVTAVLSDRNVTKLAEARVLELSDEYWRVMKDMLPVLTKLKCATTVMSSENNVSISNTYPITFSLLEKHLVPEVRRPGAPREPNRVLEFKEKVRTSLARRLQVYIIIIIIRLNQYYLLVAKEAMK